MSSNSQVPDELGSVFALMSGLLLSSDALNTALTQITALRYLSAYGEPADGDWESRHHPPVQATLALRRGCARLPAA